MHGGSGSHISSVRHFGSLYVEVGWWRVTRCPRGERGGGGGGGVSCVHVQGREGEKATGPFWVDGDGMGIDGKGWGRDVCSFGGRPHEYKHSFPALDVLFCVCRELDLASPRRATSHQHCVEVRARCWWAPQSLLRTFSRDLWRPRSV